MSDQTMAAAVGTATDANDPLSPDTAVDGTDDRKKTRAPKRKRASTKKPRMSPPTDNVNEGHVDGSAGSVATDSAPPVKTRKLMACAPVTDTDDALTPPEPPCELDPVTHHADSPPPYVNTVVPSVVAAEPLVTVKKENGIHADVVADDNPILKLFTCNNHDTWLRGTGGALLVIATDREHAVDATDAWLRNNGLKQLIDFPYQLQPLTPADEGVVIVCSNKDDMTHITKPRDSGTAYRASDLNIYRYMDVNGALPRIAGAVVFAKSLHGARRLLRQLLESKYPIDYKGVPDKTGIPEKLHKLSLPLDFATGQVFPLSEWMMIGQPVNFKTTVID